MRARVAQQRRDRHARTDRVSGRDLDLERQLLPRLISNATAGEGRYCAATKPISGPPRRARVTPLASDLPLWGDT
jgi:hypothetical protein